MCSSDLSLMWGDYKDKVDELTMEMNKNSFLFEELKISLNDQIQLLANSKARFSMMLSEARSNLAADREEVKAKEQQNVDNQAEDRELQEKRGSNPQTPK